MTDKTVLTKKNGGIWTITLNRPEKLNSFNPEMFSKVTQALVEIENDPEVRVVVITGAGKAFSAGVDVEHMSFDDLKQSEAYIKTDAAMFRQIENSRVPVITAVNGDAFGGGCKVAFVSDIAIATEGARFGLQGIKLGAVHVISLGRGMDVLGRQRLGYMLLSGNIIDARTAEHWGLVSKVVPPDNLYTEVYELAERIVKYPPKAAEIIKRLLHRGNDDDYRVEDLLSPFLLTMEDFKEGTRAFLHKRKPIFKGK